MTFFVKDSRGDLVALLQNASEEEVMSVLAATLRISNQKNGHVGTCVPHEARALVRRVARIGMMLAVTMSPTTTSGIQSNFLQRL